VDKVDCTKVAMHSEACTAFSHSNMGFIPVRGMTVCSYSFWQCFLLIICRSLVIGLISHPWSPTSGLELYFELEQARGPDV
jgi:hypothetical protein